MINQKYILSFFITFFVISAAHACAQEEHVNPTGIQISPIRIDWQMAAGEQRTGKFNVRNYGTLPRHISVNVENFFVSPDSEHVNLFGSDAQHPRHVYNVIDWFSVPESFTLEPGEGRDVEFHVTVPEGQPTNGYYGTILFQTKNKAEGIDEAESVATLGVNYRVGAIVTLAIQGDGEPIMDGRIEQFDSERTWYIDAPMDVTLGVLNNGNMHYKMIGEIVITRFGKPFTTIKIGPEVLYPGATRTFINKIPFDTWDFGVYDARVEMRSEYGDVNLASEIHDLYIFPRMGLIYSVSGILGTIFIFWFMRNFVTIGSKKKKS